MALQNKHEKIYENANKLAGKYEITLHEALLIMQIQALRTVAEYMP